MKFSQNFLAGVGVLTAGAKVLTVRAEVLTAGAGGEMTGVCTVLGRSTCYFFEGGCDLQFGFHSIVLEIV